MADFETDLEALVFVEAASWLQLNTPCASD
jgi:hypothetical protein